MRGWLFSGLILCSTLTYGQSQSELESRAIQLQDEIELANTILDQAKKEKSLSLTQVRALDKKLRSRQELINTIKRQVKQAESDIRSIEREIVALDAQIKVHQSNYAGMLREAQRTSRSNAMLRYILSAESFNQAMKRIYYMRQVSRFRMDQVDAIRDLQGEKVGRLAALETERGRIRGLLSKELAQRRVLVSERTAREVAVTLFKSKEREILTEIRAKRSELDKLKKQIQRIISLELKRQREAARLAAAKTSDGTVVDNSDDFALTPEGRALAASFSSNKGKLPWPVARGIVTEPFGENTIPGTSDVKINNPGIDISTPRNTEVRAVFNGEVSTVVRIPGAGRVVLLSHGNYFTVYSNLDEVFVVAGDKVDVKEAIGKVATDPESGDALLNFELWENTDNQNPQPWLSK